ncbi:nucleoporin-domain-containing protein [Atractiella rhizophila]|nr:nucleoporin-domain-containing protein [Atractiella rhizophila]
MAQPHLSTAANVIDSRIANDTLPPLYSFVSQGVSPPNTYSIAPSPLWAPFFKKESYMMPDAVLDEINVADGASGAGAIIGVLKEVERAYVAFGKRIWLWDWKDPDNLHVFDQIDDTIVGVGLVVPKPGMFVDTIKHLLVVSTPTSVTLFGLALATAQDSPTNRSDLAIYLTNLSVPTYGLTLSSFGSTTNGRIFCVGSTGHLHEIDYRSEETYTRKQCEVLDWTKGGLTNNPRYALLNYFSPKTAVQHSGSIDDRTECRVDSERGLVYCLQRGNSIEMYNIWTSSGSLDGAPDLRVKITDLCREALRFTVPSQVLDPKTCRLISLDIIGKDEAGDSLISLMACTNTGVRLYFSHRSVGYMSSYPALQLHHVRLPPSGQPAASTSIQPPYGSSNPQTQPSHSPGFPVFDNIAAATCFKRGFFLASTAGSIDELNSTSNLIAAAPDAGKLLKGHLESRSTSGVNPVVSLAGTRMSPQLFEFSSLLDIEGSVWALEDISPPSAFFASHELAGQTFDKRREFLIVTNMGTNLVVRQRPVDVLFNLLNTGIGVSSTRDTDLQLFCENFGRDQTCAMCLCVAAGIGILSLSKSEDGMTVTGQRQASHEAINSAKRLLYELGGHATSLDRMFTQGSQASISQGSLSSDGKVAFSGRHEALAICLARLLRPIWKEKVVVQTAQNLPVTSAVPEKTLIMVQRDLSALQSFVERDWQLFTAIVDQRRHAGQERDSNAAEQQSLNTLRLLLTQAVEAIAFTLLLIDYQLPNIVAGCTEAIRTGLMSLTYQTLLTTESGREIARSLVNVIINQQIGQQQSIDAISDILQHRCGSFCSAEDVLLYKALESLRRASTLHVPSERNSTLHEALRLLLKATKHLSHEKLLEICNHFNSLHFPSGAIDLALACARQWDSENKGLAFWQQGMPPTDTVGRELYNKREACYKMATETLEKVDQMRLDVLSSTRIASGGKQASLQADEIKAIQENAFGKALSSDDECFHHFLYRWYLQHNMVDQLLRVRSSFIEGFLRRFQRWELLWQYYVENSSYLSAAIVLSHLADSEEQYTLAARIEYLSLALANAKSQPPTPADASEVIQLVQHLEEKLEVAQVQLGIVRDLQDNQDIDLELRAERLAKLNEKLFSISELYNEFALPLDLFEMQLVIFNVAEYDEQDSEGIYRTIFEHVKDKGFDAVGMKFTDLARRLYPATFPLRSIVLLLEEFDFKEVSATSLQSHWIVNALLAGGIPHSHLFNVLDDLWRSKAIPFHTSDGLLHLTREIVFLTETWLKHGKNVYAAEIQAALGRHLMGLSSLGFTSQDLVRRLKELQNEILQRY